MKIYKGRRSSDDNGAVAFIEVDGKRRELPRRYDIANHSPDGFEWGYGGSGPAQLALALCIDALGGNNSRMAGACQDTSPEECFAFQHQRCRCENTGRHDRHKCSACGYTWMSEAIRRAVNIYQHFKFRYIAGIFDNEWQMTPETIVQQIEALEQEQARRREAVPQ